LCPEPATWPDRMYWDIRRNCPTVQRRCAPGRRKPTICYLFRCNFELLSAKQVCVVPRVHRPALLASAEASAYSNTALHGRAGGWLRRRHQPDRFTDLGRRAAPEAPARERSPPRRAAASVPGSTRCGGRVVAHQRPVGPGGRPPRPTPVRLLAPMSRLAAQRSRSCEAASSRPGSRTTRPLVRSTSGRADCHRAATAKAASIARGSLSQRLAPSVGSEIPFMQVKSRNIV
jgi:hypothetical protein